MPKIWDTLNEMWPGVATLLGAASSALLTFRNLIDMPLNIRLAMVGCTGIVMVALLVVALSPPPERRRAGYIWTSSGRPSVPGIILKVVLILAACSLAIFLVRETVTYHNLVLSQHFNADDPQSGEVQLQPSHFVTAVTLTFDTHQPDVRILGVEPRDCGEERLAQRPDMKDLSDFSVTFYLTKFRAAQKFCIPYRLSQKADQLHLVATPDLPDVEALSDERVAAHYKLIWYFGGILCLLALLFFSYRCSWFRAPPS